MVVRKIARDGSWLRQAIINVIERDRSLSAASADTADAVLAVIDEAKRTPCTDGDCARVRRHRVIDEHLWRHDPQPPLARIYRFGCWRCFTCAHRLGHRVHRTGKAAVAS